ncbi:copper-binding protein [Afipia massiliensis]|uniref:Copper-binding protein n=1 Tax=Afipia massiliensis TaxID=211460 RepID=A0A4U6BPK0_9BRAD|nr:copper-binding protein [Afipia massiliensis]TKT71811.1 copper-binding protein [Afipia massiliensis]
MRKLILATSCFIALSALLPAAPAHAQALPVSGTVTKIDEAAGKMTIKHGPIKKMDMEGMTMVFRAQAPDMLKRVKVGDNVRFDVDKVNGQMTLTGIEKVK